MDGHTAKKGLLRGWWWSLNDQPKVEEASDTHKTADAFEGVTYQKDIADQVQRDELVNYRPPDFKFPPVPMLDILPIKVHDAKVAAMIAEVRRTNQQKADELIRSITQHRAGLPTLDSS